MLSRVASSIYWMARYLERADNVARFLNVNAQLMLDRGDDQLQWEPLIQVTGDDEDFTERYSAFTEENVVYFLTFDPENPNSILSCISAVRENARTVREVIASELWEMINELYHYVRQHCSKERVHDLQQFYRKIKLSTCMFTGLIENTMSHGEAWHFSRLGQMLERADKTARILDVKYFLLLPQNQQVGSLYDAVEWGAVLKSANAFEMYHKKFHRMNYKNVSDFLIFDRYFPRSVMCCVLAAAQSLNAITELLQKDFQANVQMLALQTMLSNANLEHVLANGLHEFIDLFQYQSNVVDTTIYEAFFAPKEIYSFNQVQSSIVSGIQPFQTQSQFQS